MESKTSTYTPGGAAPGTNQWKKVHFQVNQVSLSKRGLVHNCSPENVFNLRVNEKLFLYESVVTSTLFENEAIFRKK